MHEGVNAKVETTKSSSSRIAHHHCSVENSMNEWVYRIPYTLRNRGIGQRSGHELRRFSLKHCGEKHETKASEGFETAQPARSPPTSAQPTLPE